MTEKMRKKEGHSMKARVMTFFCLVVSLFTISNLYSVYSEIKFQEAFDTMLTRYYTINQFLVTFTDDVELYDRYLDDKSETNWMNYMRNNLQVNHYITNMIQDAQNQSLNGYLLTQSVKNMYVTYDEMVRSSLSDPGEAVQMEQIRDISEMISSNTIKLLQANLSYGLETYHGISTGIETHRIISGNLIIIVITIAIVFLSFLSDHILNPLILLAENIKAVEQEQFQIPDLPVDKDDEIGRTNRSFNSMKARLQQVIAELKAREELTRQLHERELKVINSEKMLESARLSYLQSQINPHFLFNTLNAISGMATVEKARTTNEMILCLARIFRYNLENTHRIVPIVKELSLIKNYIYIEKKRFGERLNYVLKADIDLKNYGIPPLTLQPMVENCINHGILKRENGGTVEIKLFLSQGFLVLKVLDNGVGMEEAQRQALLSGKKLSGMEGVRSGIGMRNVFDRLKLAYPDCQIKIYSKKNRGTCIEIRIKEEECSSEESIDRG